MPLLGIIQEYDPLIAFGRLFAGNLGSERFAAAIRIRTLAQED